MEFNLRPTGLETADDNVRRGKRRMADEFDLDRRREPTNVVAVVPARMKTVSETLNSRAMFCSKASSSSRASTQTTAGFPPNGAAENASTQKKSEGSLI